MRNTTVTVVLLGLFLISAAAWAAEGYHYTAETVTTGTNIKTPTTTIVEIWVKSLNAKIVILGAGEATPLFGEGKFILADGETFYLVDTKENTHAKFDPSDLLGIVGSVMDSGILNMEVSNYSIEELERRDGPDMHGYDTEYRKYLTSYDLEMKIMGMKRADHHTIELETWDTDKVDAFSFDLTRLRKTGIEAIDTLMKGEFEKFKGFSFKSVTTDRTEGAKKKRSATTITTTKVNLFEEMNVADSMFELHPDSQEISLLGLGASQTQDSKGEPKEEKKVGVRERLRRLRKGDG